MSGQEMSFRESTLEGLRFILSQLLATLEDTPSKPIVVRRITEAFQREEKAIGDLCDTTECRLRAQQEIYLCKFKDSVEAATDKIFGGLKQPVGLSSFKQELNQLKQVMSGSSELDEHYEKFVEELMSEFGQEATAIVDKFHREAIGIMSEGILADNAVVHLDPDSSTKH